MNRVALLLCALALAACGGSSSGGGGGTTTHETSAQTVASSSTDFSGLTKCPESGTWDEYLKAEQAKDPSQYATDKTDWDSLKGAGANNSYIAVYADSPSACGSFGSSTPSGKVVTIYAIRFKDSASASDNFKTNSKTFHLSDSDLQNIQSAGGKVAQGDATSLGTNSIAVSLSIAGTSFYVAFWQRNKFEVAMIAYNIPVADAEAAAKKVNGRIT